MILYAESSAVLSWLFNDTFGKAVSQTLAKARIVLTSRLTITECQRVLIRAKQQSVLNEISFNSALNSLMHASATWSVMDITNAIHERVGKEFPQEPVRCLDAIHLATLLEWSKLIPEELCVLSCDHRIRENVRRFKMPLCPESIL